MDYILAVYYASVVLTGIAVLIKLASDWYYGKNLTVLKLIGVILLVFFPVFNLIMAIQFFIDHVSDFTILKGRKQPKYDEWERF